MRTVPVLAHRERGRQGVALIVVLAFIVLLTGLIVAFFSRAMTERQNSNSSANQTGADLLAQGAVDSLVGDFKQEIAAGSNTTTFTNSTAATATILGAVYLPVNARAAMPALALVGQSTGVTSFAPNLVKRSAYQQPFFADASVYNSANTTTTTALVLPVVSANTTSAAAPARAASNRAANVSTASPAANGRSISAARWNRHLLLPKANPADDLDLTPITSGANGFVAPDWILVGRDGSNPVSFGTAATAINAPANPNYVVGRYAYAIYDEGGLLDLNVAGYPTGLSATAAAFKSSQSFADLTALPGIGPVAGIAPFTAARQAQVIDALVGWRNYASAALNVATSPAGSTPLGGTFPSLTWAAQNHANYVNFVRFGSKGYLVADNSQLVGGQSDRLFSSRQEMMKLILQGVATPGAAGVSERANLQNALQYLTHFSRDINQPSYAPLPALTPPDATHRPAVVAVASGGNNAVGLDDVINPGFLTTRVYVTQAGLRNDSTSLTAGEPLVKKRFVLSRLSWLTYKGPSATLCAATAQASDPLIKALVAQGIPFTLLQQGTATNIQKYFGLNWAADTNAATGAGGVADNQSKWFYNVHQWAPAPSVGTGSTGPIMKLGDIAQLNGLSKQHEPDFFELLKATINVGSLAKAANPSGTDYQNLNDQSVDYQVVQIGANIIDQYDVDGFPTRIIFNDGSKVGEFRGVENVPYIYRYHAAIMRLQLANPDVIGYYSGWDPGRNQVFDGSGRLFGPTQPVSFRYKPDPTGEFPLDGSTAARSPQTLVTALTKTGVNALLYLPEVWNPHDVNSTRCMADPTTGSPVTDASGNAMFPTRFRVVAQSSAPGVAPIAFFLTDGWGAGLNQAVASNSNVDKSVPFPVYANLVPAIAGTGGFQHSRVMSPANTGLYFDVPNNSATAVANLYREPTLLFKPGIGNAGGLAQGLTGKDPTSTGEDNAILKPNIAVDGQFKDGATLFTSGSGISDGFITDPMLVNSRGYNPKFYPRVGEKYLGIYIDCAPMAYKSSGGANDFYTMRQIYGGPPTITLMLQCETAPGSGKWMTYDEKVTGSGFGQQNQVFAQTGFLPSRLTSSNQTNFALDVLDPRTSRFGFGNCTTSFWLSSDGSNPLKGWLDEANGVVASSRPDYERGDMGVDGAGYSVANGFYPAPSVSALGYTDANVSLFPTLFSQNRPDVANNARVWVADSGAAPPNPLVSAFYTDADGVARRAAGAYVAPAGSTDTPANKPAKTLIGLPLATAETAYSGKQRQSGSSSLFGPVSATQSQSRPVILNRPFRSVMELGYVFKGTPWKNLDFFTAESGDAALLDVFCIQDTDNPDILVAGKVNLNTRNVPVLQAVLSGGYKDEANSFVTPPGGTLPPLSVTETSAIATALQTRTTSGTTTVNGAPSAPLANLSELIGKWVSYQTIPSATPIGVGAVVSSAVAPNNISGGLKVSGLNPSYDGLTADLDSIFSSSPATMNIQRMRESAIRPLASTGQTRVWNLMIDLVAQTGRYAASASRAENPLAAFTVEGEQRYWVHIAIDRFTGQVIDKQVEVVKE